MFPIYIPSYNRAETIKTTVYLDSAKVPYKLILNTDACADAYTAGGRCNPKNIIVTGDDRKGITYARNWIAANLAKRGQWYLSLDDNISTFTRVIDPWYGKLRTLDVNSPDVNQKDFDQEIPASELQQILELDIALAEKIKAEYIGFATVPNYYFNAKKYRAVGYLIAKACLIKYDGLGYDLKLEAMEEFGFLADQLVKNNAVLINDWVHAKANHYEEGGIGPYEQRLPRKIADCAYLMWKYPQLFRYKVKKGCHPKAELQLRFHKPEQVIQWKRRARLQPLTRIEDVYDHESS